MFGGPQCGPAAGTGDVRFFEPASFELLEGIWGWRGDAGDEKKTGTGFSLRADFQRLATQVLACEPFQGVGPGL